MLLVARPLNPYPAIVTEIARFRDTINLKLAGSRNLFGKVDVAGEIIEDIITLLFLIDAGFVRDGLVLISAEGFFSRILSFGTSALAQIQSGVLSSRNGNPTNSGKNADMLMTKHLDPLLFHGVLSEPWIGGALDAAPIWRDFLEYLRGFHWSIDENLAPNSDTVPTITPVVFSRIHELDMAKKFSVGVKKHTGSYYTPASISRYICSQCITQYIVKRTGTEGKCPEDLIARLEKGDLEGILEVLRRVRVLDPSCGSGEFLVAMAHVLYSLRTTIANKLPAKLVYNVRALKSSILTDNIFGTELSTDAIDIAKKRLWLWMLSGNDHENNDQHTLPCLDVNIISGNALIGWLDEDIFDDTKWEPSQSPNECRSNHDVSSRLARSLELSMQSKITKNIDLEPYHPIHWRLVFRELFKKERGFDIVVGNPPYVFVRGKNFDDIERGYFNNWYFQGFSTITKGKARQSGKINAFSLFIARSVNLIKKGGILGFIVPNTLLRTTTNDIIRQFITTSTIVHEIVDLQDGVFDGVVASTIVLILEKGSDSSRGKRTIVKHDVEDLQSGKYKSHEVDQERFSLNPACIFDIHTDDRFTSFFSTMRKDSAPLIDACSEIIEGLVTRRGDGMFTTDPSRANAKKLLRGKDIDRYKVTWHPDQYIIYEPGMLHRARPVAVHEAPVKLLAQRIGGGMYPLRVAYDDRQHYFFASINAIILRKVGNEPHIVQRYKYILAILNSAVMNAYYLLNFSNKSALTVNVSKTFVGSLPIKEAAPGRLRCIVRIVDYLLFLNRDGNDGSKLIEFFDKLLLDAIIFDLYAGYDQKETFFCSMFSFLSEIDPEESGGRKAMDILEDAMVTIKNDVDCTRWLHEIQDVSDFKAIKKLFEERGNGIVDYTDIARF